MAGDSRLRRLIGNAYRIGLGGEGLLRTEGRGQEAQKMLVAAYGSGIRYFDSAPAYADSERYYRRFWDHAPGLGNALVPDQQIAHRDAKGASADLTNSSPAWVVIDSGSGRSTMSGPATISTGWRGLRGCTRAFYHARETGTTLGIGVTGHQPQKSCSMQSPIGTLIGYFSLSIL